MFTIREPTSPVSCVLSSLHSHLIVVEMNVQETYAVSTTLSQSPSLRRHWIARGPLSSRSSADMSGLQLRQALVLVLDAVRRHHLVFKNERSSVLFRAYVSYGLLHLVNLTCTLDCSRRDICCIDIIVVVTMSSSSPLDSKHWIAIGVLE